MLKVSEKDKQVKFSASFVEDLGPRATCCVSSKQTPSLASRWIQRPCKRPTGVDAVLLQGVNFGQKQLFFSGMDFFVEQALWWIDYMEYDEAQAEAYMDFFMK